MSRAPENIDRNVRFLDANNDECAGFWQNGSVTWEEVLEWMHIIFTDNVSGYTPARCLENGDPRDPTATDNHGPPIPLAGNTLKVDPGYYIILSQDGTPAEVHITSEIAAPRSVSQNLSNAEPRRKSFMERVRARDRRCVITGQVVRRNNFSGFQAAHIFPLAQLDKWNTGQWSGLITDDFDDTSESKIHSVQNGLLLRADVHILFDRYVIAINPDNDYKVTCFIEDGFALDGRHAVLNTDYPEKYQPHRALLKHHWRMAVLSNIKAHGPEYSWDDLEPGVDPVQEISSSEMGKLRFETVMAEKLNDLIA